MTLHLRPVPHAIEFAPAQPAGIIIKGKFHKCRNGAVAILQHLFSRQGTFVSPAEISAATHVKRANVAPYISLGRQMMSEHASLRVFTHKSLGYMMRPREQKAA